MKNATKKTFFNTFKKEKNYKKMRARSRKYAKNAEGAIF